jgi:hypothetical protein
MNRTIVAAPTSRVAIVATIANATSAFFGL